MPAATWTPPWATPRLIATLAPNSSAASSTCTPFGSIDRAKKPPPPNSETVSRNGSSRLQKLERDGQGAVRERDREAGAKAQVLKREDADRAGRGARARGSRIPSGRTSSAGGSPNPSSGMSVLISSTNESGPTNSIWPISTFTSGLRPVSAPNSILLNPIRRNVGSPRRWMQFDLAVHVRVRARRAGVEGRDHLHRCRVVDDEDRVVLRIAHLDRLPDLLAGQRVGDVAARRVGDLLGHDPGHVARPGAGDDPEHLVEQEDAEQPRQGRGTGEEGRRVELARRDLVEPRRHRLQARAGATAPHGHPRRDRRPRDRPCR